jgi:hypothetical protein
VAARYRLPCPCHAYLAAVGTASCDIDGKDELYVR